jgi:hypothetical protein
VSGFDLRGLVASLSDHEVDYVIVGGVAVVAHGYLRATRDLDVVPDHDRENLRRLASALRDMDATLPLAKRPFDTASDLQHLERRRNMTLDTMHGGLDVIQRAPGVHGFATLSADAVGTEILGVPVRVCSLAHLREMKAAAGRAQDRADLENLPEP